MNIKRTTTLLILSLALVNASTFAEKSPFSNVQTEAIAHTVVKILTTTLNGSTETGSGVIISSNGIVFTNSHVVQDADEIRIQIFDKFESPPVTQYMARITTISEDPSFDFAVLEIFADINGRSIDQSSLALPCISPWQSEVNITENVYFFTYPQIAAGSLSITSGTITTIQTRPTGNQRLIFFQSDAVFARGASGGLAVNANGEFIGLPFEAISEEGAQLTSILPIDTICTVEPEQCRLNQTTCENILDLVPTISVPCPSVISQIVSLGERARVTFDPGTSNNLRSNPDTSSSLIMKMPPGMEFEIIEGFRCADGYRWWQVKLDNGTTGWTADGDSNEHWIEPISSNTPSQVCGNTLSANVLVGQRARVTHSPGTSNNVRTSANQDAEVIVQIQPGTEFEVIGGPICADGYRWWAIQLDSGMSGWTADGDNRNHWIEPLL